MLRLLILDDELHAIRGIQAELDLEKLGISHVHTALHASQAMELFRQHPVDVLICDIEMPEINGLQFAAWVKEHYPLTQCIILTCHSDFTYAKEAVHLGSIEYLLKPAPIEELEAAILKADEKLRKLQEQDRFAEAYQRAYELWLKHMPLVVERFWYDLLRENIPSKPGTILDTLRNLQLEHMGDKHFLPVLIQVDRWYREWSVREEKIMQYALMNSANECIAAARGQGTTLQLDHGDLLCIVMLDNQEDWSDTAAIQACRDYIHSCNLYFYCDLTCYIGSPVPIHQLTGALRPLHDLKKKHVMSRNEVYTVREPDPSGFEPMMPQLDHWQEALQAGRVEILELSILEYWETVTKQGGLDQDFLDILYHNFLQMIHYTLKLKGLQAHLIFSGPDSDKLASFATRSVFHMQEWMAHLIRQAVLHMEAVNETPTVVKKVERYILDNLSQSLTREQIAGHVYLNPDYLARIFKRETGLSILDYLMEERMKAAQQLLAQTDLPVSTIAERVGITHFSYFSKQFKKHLNMSPVEFRQQKQMT